MLIKYVDRKHRFREIFNTENGFYVRSGVIDENDHDTGVDPFMRSFPQLLDVGIMGNCEHGRSGLCLKAGIQCYQNGLNKTMPHMSFESFKKIVDQSRGKVFQIALGGRGDPNKHPEFEKIVKYCRQHNIAPNYTTSGLNLSAHEVWITKEFTGAVAVSWYRHPHTERAIKMFLEAGCKTNIHYVLGNNSIDEAIERLKLDRFPPVNAVIFLLHKPVGMGKQENVLSPNDPRIGEFFNLIDTKKFSFKIGFDACSIPGLVNYTKNINPMSFDKCEASRFSMYISSDMKALPCSFDSDDQRWSYDISNDTIQNAWDSSIFNNFRQKFNVCSSCSKKENCSPCPITPVITLCSSFINIYQGEHKENIDHDNILCKKQNIKENVHREND